MKSRWLPIYLCLALLVVLAACRSAASTSTPTPPPRRTSTPIPTLPTPSSSPTPIPPIPGPAITVALPIPQQRIGSPVRIVGAARVFEGAIEAAVKDASGKTLGSGFTTASSGAPEWGSFEMELSFTQPAADGPGKVEVFSRSPRDGSIDVLTVVPVILAGR